MERSSLKTDYFLLNSIKKLYKKVVCMYFYFKVELMTVTSKQLCESYRPKLK